MTLEKAKTKKKITKSQLQKQKQVQNVIVNLQAPVKKTRKRTTRPKPVQIPSKSPFQSPIYMPAVASYNQPKQDNNSILSDILKHINKPTKPEPNELEKAKPTEREPEKPPEPTLPPSFGVPEQRTSLIEEIRSDPFNTRQTFSNQPVYEARQESFKFNAPLRPEAMPVSLLQQIRVGREKKFEPPTDQPWADLETGGHFGLMGINTEQLKAHKEAKKQFTFESLSMPILTEETRPTSEAIDLGIIPPIAQEIVQEDRVETNEPPILQIMTEEPKLQIMTEEPKLQIMPEEPKLQIMAEEPKLQIMAEEPILQIMAEEPKQKILIPEKIATKSNTEQIQMKALTMGEEKPYLKSFLHSTPLPPLKTISFTKDELDLMRGSRVKALEKPPPVKFGPEPPLGIPLSLKQEAEPILSKETNQLLSPEKEAQIKEEDPEITKLSKLTNAKLNAIITGMGGNKTNQGGGKKNKQTLIEGILELRKSQGELFTTLLDTF